MAIKFEKVSHVYSDGTPYRYVALADVDLELTEGKMTAIIGQTGSGKSTLVQHLNALLLPTSGKLTVLDKVIEAGKEQKGLKALRGQVGLVFQFPEYQLFEETVYRDIAFGPKNMKLPEAEIDRRVREAAGFVGLTEDQLQASPFDLSGGQKRRVAIAGVIAMEPEVLVLDEPTAGLDPEGREEILANIDAYRRAKGATVMMVSHSMNDVARLTDRLLVMNSSRLVMDGTPGEIFSRAQELLDMGLDIPEITRVFLELRRLGLPVEQVYTVSQAVDALAKLKGGLADA